MSYDVINDVIMSDADCIPGREPRSVAASSNLGLSRDLYNVKIVWPCLFVNVLVILQSRACFTRDFYTSTLIYYCHRARQHAVPHALIPLSSLPRLLLLLTKRTALHLSKLKSVCQSHIGI